MFYVLCAQLCPALWDPLNHRPPSFFIHGIFQARILEQVAISYSRGSSPPRDWTHVSCVSCTGRQVLYHLGSLYKIEVYFSFMNSWAGIAVLAHEAVRGLGSFYLFAPLHVSSSLKSSLGRKWMLRFQTLHPHSKQQKGRRKKGERCLRVEFL